MATVETPTEFRAQAKYVRAAPRKAQLIVSEIRGMPVAEARTALTFMTRAAAEDVAKVLASAIANAETHPDYNGEDLYVSAAFVGSGPTLKRWRARARGRVGRIKKRTCHITIRLATVEPDETTTRKRGKASAEAPPKRQRRAKPAAPAASTEIESPLANETPEATTAAAETTPKATRPRRTKAASAEASETVEAPKPRRSRAKKTDVTDTAAETTEAAQTPEKPKRAPRKKPEAAEVPEPVAEEAPAEAPASEPTDESPSAEKED